ncbi:hypothetical protein BUALT_Bualt17G0012800 [Buddleja alternifolia]|uniref:Uncharacterized protein n=1 Tax=Buddleja alternifolia TaxID=168488 RepID=A0AAV6W3L4_9LAMI|nr:hypothetical protein BUALT_Bualt17G0012800 [Buddleja alternifolia]
MATAWGALWGTRVLEIVKKHDSGGLVWKRIKLTPTRKANAKKRLPYVSSSRPPLWDWEVNLNSQNEAVLRACSEAPPPEMSQAEVAKNAAKEN